MTTILDKEQFEGAQVLADIGIKIAEARAVFAELETSKEEFLTERMQETSNRVAQVLEQSQKLLDGIDANHNELVGYRTEVEGYLDDVRYLIQGIRDWKKIFDEVNALKLAEITAKYEQNNKILEQIKGNRALLAGESEDIKRQRRNLSEEKTKINDEWATLERTATELKAKV